MASYKILDPESSVLFQGGRAGLPPGEIMLQRSRRGGASLRSPLENMVHSLCTAESLASLCI